MTDTIHEIEFFYGACSLSAAQVYLRLSAPPDGQQVQASIRGPYCKHSATLPATIPLRDAGPGATLLLKATIPDPCFWSPDLPAQYDVHITWRTAGQAASPPLREATLRAGIRMFGAHGGDFRQEGLRKVLRLIRRDSLSELPHPSQWRETAGSLWLAAPPDDDFCREASDQGIRLVVELASPVNAAQTRRELTRLRRHAAVTAVCFELDSSEDQLRDLRPLAPNILLGTRLSTTTPVKWNTSEFPPDFVVLSWSDVAGQAASDAAALNQALAELPPEIPVVIERPLAAAGSFSAARQQCDQLQRDAANARDFAGYLV